MTTTDKKQIPDWQKPMAEAMKPKEYKVSIRITNAGVNPSFIRNEFNNLALNAQTYTFVGKDLIKLQEAEAQGAMVLTATFTNIVSARNFENTLTTAQVELLKAYDFSISTETVPAPKPQQKVMK